MWRHILFLSFVSLICSCGPSTQDETRDEDRDIIKGLLTFTESGMTFLDCKDGNRYRIYDYNQAIHQLMLDMPLKTDLPLYAELSGNPGPHNSQLDLDRHFSERFDVKEAHLIEEDIPSLCDSKMMPVINFFNSEDRWQIAINYFVPAVIYTYPKYGKKLYFPFPDEVYPDPENAATELRLSSHGHLLNLLIEKKECIDELTSEAHTHQLRAIIDNEMKYACGTF